jgi:hypothetical protein
MKTDIAGEGMKCIAGEGLPLRRIRRRPGGGDFVGVRRRVDGPSPTRRVGVDGAV